MNRVHKAHRGFRAYPVRKAKLVIRVFAATMGRRAFKVSWDHTVMLGHRGPPGKMVIRGYRVFRGNGDSTEPRAYRG